MGQSTPSFSNRSSAPWHGGPKRNFALLTPAFLDELRARITLSQLIGRSIRLQKAGNEFKACCPFHQEKTPSFWVNDQKAFYHCFGCGAHGDAIRFLTEVRGLSFMDAVRELADQVGLDLPKPTPEEQARQERSLGLQDVMEAAADYFQRTLAQGGGTEARKYLERRDVATSSMAEFRIGYAPEGRSHIQRELNQFTADQLIEAGLLISVEQKEPYDRFRKRVMVPIRDPRGRVIAFGGRILGDGEPKYLNSPDTPLFDKGRVLFNLDRAAPASRQTDRVVVVEGYFDVIALSQAGIREAVAPMGTALTEAQLELLWRLVDEPILCFDGDAAGRRAAERACEKAMPSLRPGKQLRIAVLPPGKDPDDLVREGGAAKFEQALESALPLSAFLFRSEADKIDPARPEQRAALRKRLEDLAQSCSDRLVAEEFARSFRSLFFDEFGWKQKQRQKIATASIRTSARVAPDSARSILRSALHGLTRMPSVALANLEAVAALPIDHRDLARWRDAICEALLIDPNLQDDGIEAVLSASVLPEVLQFDIMSDLRFGFNKTEADPARAAKQLEVLVNFLAQEGTLKHELSMLDEAAIIDAGGDQYETIEASRQRLRDVRNDMYREAADWEGEFENVL